MGADEKAKNYKGFNPWQCLDSTISIVWLFNSAFFKKKKLFGEDFLTMVIGSVNIMFKNKNGILNFIYKLIFIYFFCIRIKDEIDIFFQEKIKL